MTSNEAEKHKDFPLVNEVLTNYLSSNDFLIKTFTIRSASENVTGFLGEYWKIRVEYVFQQSSSDVDFFYKTIPKSNKLKADYNKQYGFFDREIYYHKHILSKFKKFEGLRQCVPRCYYAANDDLVFEDLDAKGFQMRTGGQPMDKSHAVIVIKSLAIFHAGSFILDATKSNANKLYKLEDEFTGAFEGGAFRKGHWYYNARDVSLKIAATSLKYGKETDYFKMVASKWNELFDRGAESIEPSKRYKNVILHLDLWNNNIMFKYDETKQPIQCIFVDYQSCKLSTPAADIVSFMYLSLDKQTRDDAFDELINIYHKELGNILEESGLNVDQFLSLDVLKFSCEEYRLWGLIQSQVLFQFIFMNEVYHKAMANDSDAFEKLSNGDRSEEVIISLASNEVYRIRMMDIIDEFIERYVVVLKKE